MKTTINVTEVTNGHDVAEFISENIEYIGLFISLITFVAWIAGFRPRHKKISSESYFDYDSNKIIEHTTFSINWGHVFFFKRIKLPPIERNAKFSILCKPLGGIQDILHSDNYEVKSSGSTTKIALLNKDHFVNNEIETVYLETTRQAPESCRTNIKIIKNEENIEVLNYNHVEVKNFRLILPESVTLDDMIKYSGVLKDWRTSGGDNPHVTAFIDSIDSYEGGRPGKIVIPLF